MASGEKTLQARMAEGPVPIAEAKRITSAIAETLENAHEKGLVHGDLNPSNILLTTEGKVRVLGLVPASEKGDPRADILCLGEILREMLVGSPDVPELLEHVVRKMLAVRPEDRYQLVHEVLTDLNHVETEEPAFSKPRPGRRLRFGLSAVGLLAALAIVVWWMRPLPRTLSGGTLSSVAVLPLLNVSKDPLESDYLAEGISQAVATKLTQVGLRVTPYETARRYRNRGPAETIAKELNVDAVLVGTLQVSEDEILANVSLVEAASGLQSWADIIVEPYENLFHMQIRIATAVATSLKRELTGEDEAVLAAPESRSVDAYDLYLQGAHLMLNETPGAADTAFDYFIRALELDPDLADAHVGIGSVYHARYYFGWGGGFENLERAEASYERALELDPASMRARRGLMFANFNRGRMEACLVQGQAAGRLGRADDVETLLAQAEAYWYGGLPDRALPYLRRILEIDPAHQVARYWLTWLFLSIGELGRAIESGNTYLHQFGDDTWVHTNVAMSHHLLSEPSSAREHYERAIEIAAGANPNAILGLGLLLDQLGQAEQRDKTWRMGVEMSKREAGATHVRMRALHAVFQALLGNRDVLSAEEQRIFAAQDLEVGIGNFLPAARASLGQMEEADRVARYALQRGSLHHYWKVIFQLASEDPRRLPVFEDYEAEAQRLRDMY